MAIVLSFSLDRREGKRSQPKRSAATYESREAIGRQCHNPNCDVREPQSTRRRFDNFPIGQIGALILGCVYCDHRFKVQFVGNVKTKRYSSYDHSLAQTIREWLQAGELAVFDSLKEAEELGYEPDKSGSQRTLMDEAEIQAALGEISQQILRDCREPDRLVILGVRTVGSHLAQRIAAEIETKRGRKPELGEIELYGSGDEIRRLSSKDPDARPLSLKDREVILVDDVIIREERLKSALNIISAWAGRNRCALRC